MVINGTLVSIETLYRPFQSTFVEECHNPCRRVFHDQISIERFQHDHDAAKWNVFQLKSVLFKAPTRAAWAVAETETFDSKPKKKKNAGIVPAVRAPPIFPRKFRWQSFFAL